MSKSGKYPEELLKRGVRVAFESGRPIARVAADLGVGAETLRKRVGQAEADSGRRTDLLTMVERGGDPQAAPRELRAAAGERDLEGGKRVFRQGARPGPAEVSAFVDGERGRFGVEPICQALDVSASAYYQRASGHRSRRAMEDERLFGRIRELHAWNYDAYGCRRMWKALLRASERVPRCRVQRLMRDNGIRGAKRRGKPWRTTKADPQALRRPDLVQRDFSSSRPNQRWVADLI